MLPGDVVFWQSLNVGMNILKYPYPMADDGLLESDVRAVV